MSLILDALKKSEQERRRERGPDLQSIHQPVAAAPARRAPLPWWALLVTVVAVNGGAAAWWWWRLEPAQPVSTPSAATPAPAREQPEVAASTVPPAPPAATAPQPSATTPDTAIAQTPAVPPVTPAAGAQPPLQELWELPEPVRRQLPALTYSFHVYSSDPTRRTIIINNRRMREGSEIQPGLLLEEITQDGVILATPGHRVHISVLENW